jgi:alkanesulfonate monooxygenase SsuD/methylene tetrahydromethanopterin reductase-like flavin-dependent oxidoreductase (luciferase family)
MKFSISVSLERFDPKLNMRDVNARALELVQMAEAGGFEIAWAPEHHTIEFTIGPNPFVVLSYWAAHTKKIRLGTAIVQAPYWHPIRLAGEAALVDVMSDGRLEFGIGRGAYQYEFDRLAGGMPQERGSAYLREMLPILKGLWAGDYEHKGEFWSFPLATSVPRTIQKPYPPIWVAARDADTFDWAMKSGADIMTTPLSRPTSEVKAISDRYKATVAANPGIKPPRFLLLRRTCVYDGVDGWKAPVNATIEYGRYFENLFKNIGVVHMGFPSPVDYSQLANRGEYEPANIKEYMMFGTPDEVIAKLKYYEECGVQHFCYGASFGLDHQAAKRSIELFTREVMPAFR